MGLNEDVTDGGQEGMLKNQAQCSFILPLIDHDMQSVSCASTVPRGQGVGAGCRTHLGRDRGEAQRLRGW